MLEDTGYKASRFNAMRTMPDGIMMISNTYTGAVAAIPEHEVAAVRGLLRGGDVVSSDPKLVSDMVTQGFLVPRSINESARLNFLHARMNDRQNLQLIIMPTEDCNFRCTYCYESFLKGAMSRKVRTSMKLFFAKTIPKLKSLAISWFGGEPLFAYSVMQELTEYAGLLCRQNGVTFSMGITTNGYLLDADKLEYLQNAGMKYYQITLDGDALTHDVTRHLNGGGSTFPTIWNNLLTMQRSEFDFNASLRVNVDERNVPGVERLIADVKEHFGSDKRFSLNFHAIWNYGDTVQEDVELLADPAKAVIDLSRSVVASSPSHCLGFNAMGAGAMYCYASKENTLVIGADGMLYKCTVAFDDPRNHVGNLLDNGELEIDLDRFATWTATDFRSDEGCRKCFYSPACFGASCPLVRMDTGKQPCPETKVKIGETLKTYYGVYQAMANESMARGEL